MRRVIPPKDSERSCGHNDTAHDDIDKQATRDEWLVFWTGFSFENIWVTWFKAERECWRTVDGEVDPEKLQRQERKGE